MEQVAQWTEGQSGMCVAVLQIAFRGWLFSALYLNAEFVRACRIMPQGDGLACLALHHCP